MVDPPALGAGALGRVGSSPTKPTKNFWKYIYILYISEQIRNCFLFYYKGKKLRGWAADCIQE